MTHAADSYTTFRKHARPRAFERMREEVVRRILQRIPYGTTAATISARMGLDFTKRDLYELREGNLVNISDNRLFLWAERLGVPLVLTFSDDPSLHPVHSPLPSPAVVAQAA
ncbi:protein of unknown function [Beijerinckiaceae bacterium RH AL1]|nr:protein of unknown function [Beijerinckiaceae bacterium RH CH11]VVB44580.1 protein of unknown function [Beijerinckiaceae bacterium RH AL8]VVC54385.1 protein of unknown function [Beijerinckiaceae bacterium RH AL1]